MLVGILDAHFVTWFYPNVFFVDRDIARATRVDSDATSFGKHATLVNVYESSALVRRNDGALLPALLSPYPQQLLALVQADRWADAVRLCRFVKVPALWASLAALAMYQRDLNTAEVAYAAIEELDKVHYVQYMKTIPTAEARNAEFALFRRAYAEAETTLIQANLIFRAIKMHLDLFNFDR